MANDVHGDEQELRNEELRKKSEELHAINETGKRSRGDGVVRAKRGDGSNRGRESGVSEFSVKEEGSDVPAAKEGEVKNKNLPKASEAEKHQESIQARVSDKEASPVQWVVAAHEAWGRVREVKREVVGLATAQAPALAVLVLFLGFAAPAVGAIVVAVLGIAGIVAQAVVRRVMSKKLEKFAQDVTLKCREQLEEKGFARETIDKVLNPTELNPGILDVMRSVRKGGELKPFFTGETLSQGSYIPVKFFPGANTKSHLTSEGIHRLSSALFNDQEAESGVIADTLQGVMQEFEASAMRSLKDRCKAVGVDPDLNYLDYLQRRTDDLRKRGDKLSKENDKLEGQMKGIRRGLITDMGKATNEVRLETYEKGKGIVDSERDRCEMELGSVRFALDNCYPEADLDDVGIKIDETNDVGKLSVEAKAKLLKSELKKLGELDKLERGGPSGKDVDEQEEQKDIDGREVGGAKLDDMLDEKLPTGLPGKPQGTSEEVDNERVNSVKMLHETLDQLSSGDYGEDVKAILQDPKVRVCVSDPQRLDGMFNTPEIQRQLAASAIFAERVLVAVKENSASSVAGNRSAGEGKGVMRGALQAIMKDPLLVKELLKIISKNLNVEVVKGKGGGVSNAVDEFMEMDADEVSRSMEILRAFQEAGAESLMQQNPGAIEQTLCDPTAVREMLSNSEIAEGILEICNSSRENLESVDAEDLRSVKSLRDNPEKVAMALKNQTVSSKLFQSLPLLKNILKFVVEHTAVKEKPHPDLDLQMSNEAKRWADNGPYPAQQAPASRISMDSEVLTGVPLESRVSTQEKQVPARESTVSKEQEREESTGKETGAGPSV